MSDSIAAPVRQASLYPENIPVDLRAIPQWLCWQYRFDDPLSKPKKTPISPRSGFVTSVTDRSGFATFDEALQAYYRRQMSGIGFVFTKEDDFTGIDLDDCDFNAGPDDWQRRIYEAFDTYTEYSPSRRGYHLILRGEVPSGRRSDKVEVYSDGRFFTMTGDVSRVAPIIQSDDTLHSLWLRLGSGDRNASAVAQHFKSATEDDEAILQRASIAANGETFLALWNGDGTAVSGSDKSGSAIDQALVNILQFWTKDPAQIERLWLRSPQAQRSKTRDRDPYRRMTIERAFDREVPAVDISSPLAQLEAMMSAAKTKPHDPTIDMPTGLLPIVKASAFAGKAPSLRSWLVEDMIPARNVTLLGGDGGTGKSLVALQLAVSVAAGRRWLGQAVMDGTALFVTAEDEIEEVHRRLADIVRMEGVALDSIPNLAISSLAGHDALLATFDGRSASLKPTDLCGALWAYCDEHRPVVVVLDTLADLFGGEENSRPQVRQFVGLLRGLALRFNVAVVLLAHPSLTGIASGSGSSGSTAWNNSVRSRLYLTRDNHNRILETKKANYGPVGNQLRLEYRSGVFVKIGHTSQEPAHRKEAEDAADELFVQLLAEFTAQGRYVSQKPKSTNYAPKLFANSPNANGFKIAGFEAAMERQFTIGRLRIARSNDAPSRQTDIIALAEPSNTPANMVQSPSNTPANTPTDTLQTPYEHVLP